ncbi:MAG: glycosyltransferase family 39 protein [Phycisphaerae bacterium]|nr:glycosyltransferase family 39 protein [Phycisphaerae bacterium]
MEDTNRRAGARQQSGGLTAVERTPSIEQPRVVQTRCSVRLLLIGWGLLGLVMLAAGPRLGDHEVIVAQIARQTLATGEWLVPHYLDTPFLVKPPLSPWLSAVLGSFLPNDSATGLPVTEFVARMPSLLATALTIWIVFTLARAMFERRTAQIAAFVYATTVGSMLYALNATAEALLTLFCTWAFAEFWWSRQAKTKRRQLAHQVRFYIALGLAMLAKGPMPLPVVALPIAVWWWCGQPTRLVAAGGPSVIPRAARLGMRKILPGLRRSLSQLGLWWGLPLFLLLFLPWMIWVARREPCAWSLWSYEYLDRARGDYPGSSAGRYLYYVPILFGMLIPWCLSLPEALISPFRRGHRRNATKPLTYVWYWVIVGFVILSVMSFKKPYYILPVLPGCVLLLAPVLERLFFEDPAPRPHRVRAAVKTVVIGVLVACIVGSFVIEDKYPWTLHGRVAWGVVICAGLAVLGIVLACVLFLLTHRKWSFCIVGCNSVFVFTVVWCFLGPSLGNANDAAALARQANHAGIPADTPLYWAGNRPDGRVVFYGGRPVRQVVDFYKLIAEEGDAVDRDGLCMIAAERLSALLERAEPVQVVFQRGQLHLFTSVFHPHARELFSIDRDPVGPDDHDWVVVTNAAARKNQTP